MAEIVNVPMTKLLQWLAKEFPHEVPFITEISDLESQRYTQVHEWLDAHLGKPVEVLHMEGEDVVMDIEGVKWCSMFKAVYFREHADAMMFKLRWHNVND